MATDGGSAGTEQAIRPAVVNCTVWGCNRTERGAWAQGVLLSVLDTARLRGGVLEHVAKVLQALPHQRPRRLSAGSG